MRTNCRNAITLWGAGRPSPRSALGGSIWTDGLALFSYWTALAGTLRDGTVVLNTTRYSTTTSTHQNALRAEFPRAVLVDDIPQGHRSRSLLLAEGEDILATLQEVAP
jgi:hypothetical protein